MEIPNRHFLIIGYDDTGAKKLERGWGSEMVNCSDLGANGLAASALATGTALEAAPRLSHDLVRGQSQADLLEVPASHPGLAQGHLLTGLLRKVL